MPFSLRPLQISGVDAYWVESSTPGSVAWERMSERQYFADCLAHFGGDRDLAQTFGFVVASSINDPDDNLDLDDLPNGRKTVLLYLSRESGRRVSGRTATRFHAVFQAYLMGTKASTNVFPLPIGAVDGRWCVDRPARSGSESGVFFSGILTQRRTRPLMAVSDPADWRTWLYSTVGTVPGSTPVLRRLTNVLGAPSVAAGLSGRIVLAGQWAGAMPADEYRAALLNSEIALCPGGFLSVETFRLYEAASAGCAIVSEPLPDTPFYRGHPFVEVPRGGGWLPAVRGAKRRAGELGEAARDFWERSLSPAATAGYIRQQLRGASIT